MNKQILANRPKKSIGINKYRLYDSMKENYYNLLKNNQTNESYENFTLRVARELGL